MTIVCDASLLVGALLAGETSGRWASDVLASDALVAPQILPAEVASALRRHEAAGHIPAHVAAAAYEQMLALTIDLYPYEPFAERIWELRRNLTVYDAWYVALAEAYDLDLATLDRRLVAAPGMRCRFVLPPGR